MREIFAASMYILGIEIPFVAWLILAILGGISVFMGLKELLGPDPDD